MNRDNLLRVCSQKGSEACLASDVYQMPPHACHPYLQVDVIDGAFGQLQEQLQEDRRLLPEAARMHAAFLDAVITQAFLDDAPIMSLVGRLMQSALHLPELAAVGPLSTRPMQMQRPSRSGCLCYSLHSDAEVGGPFPYTHTPPLHAEVWPLEAAANGWTALTAGGPASLELLYRAQARTLTVEQQASFDTPGVCRACRQTKSGRRPARWTAWSAACWTPCGLSTGVAHCVPQSWHPC